MHRKVKIQKDLEEAESIRRKNTVKNMSMTRRLLYNGIIASSVGILFILGRFLDRFFDSSDTVFTKSGFLNFLEKEVENDLNFRVEFIFFILGILCVIILLLLTVHYDKKGYFRNIPNTFTKDIKNSSKGEINSIH